MRKTRLISNFLMSQHIYYNVTIHILSNISQSKGNQTLKFGQIIEYSDRNIFLQILWRKRGRETRSRPPFTF